MRTENYVVFHNDSDDSYMNSSRNFMGADVGTTFIDMYFKSAGASSENYDRIRLTVTATKEESALEAVGSALAGAKAPVTVIADDINSNYIDDGITAVHSINLQVQGSYETVENITASQTLYNYDSGKIFVVNPAALTTITLPTAAAGTTTSNGGPGWNCKIVFSENDGGVVDQKCNIATAAGEFFQGCLFSDDSNGTNSIANGTSNDHINLVNSAAQSDIWFNIVSDGTYMRVETQSMVDATDIAFADTALS